MKLHRTFFFLYSLNMQRQEVYVLQEKGKTTATQSTQSVHIMPSLKANTIVVFCYS